MKSSVQHSLSISPITDEHSQSTERLTYLSETELRKRMLESVSYEQVLSSSTVIEYNRRMRLSEDTQDLEPEESSHFEFSAIESRRADEVQFSNRQSQIETPRFSEPMLKVPLPNHHVHTFGSVSSSPTSDCERVNKAWSLIFPRDPEVHEVSWEDSTNKRDDIARVEINPKLLLRQFTEESANKSSSISITQLYSMDIDTPQPSQQGTKLTQFSTVLEQPEHLEPTVVLEDQQYSFKTSFFGLCSLSWPC